MARNHLVHVVTADLEQEEQRGPQLFYWPKHVHPTTADAVIAVHNLEHLDPYSADLLILASNGIGAYLGPDDEYAAGLDAVACFSQTHIDLLERRHARLPRGICHVTGLGVDLADYNGVTERNVPGQLLYANDPQRGLLALLRIYERVKKDVPEASLRIAYDFDRVFNQLRWNAHAVAEELWECRALMQLLPDVVNLGALTRAEVVREQLACALHVMPSNPPNIGSQIHGITQMECAAARTPLVLSDVEAFPEVFGDAAEILPAIGAFLPSEERRCDLQDWADVVVRILRDPKEAETMADAAYRLATRHTWEHVIGRWERMLAALTEAHAVRAETALAHSA